MPKIVGIAWAEHSNRLDAISEGLGGESVKISWLSGRKYLAPIRYLFLGIRTISRLGKLDPDVVIAQNPPIFCPLFAYFYAKLYGRRLVIDCHSLARDKAKSSIVWRALADLELFLMKRAVVNSVIHEAYSVELDRLGVKKLVLYDAPPDLDTRGKKRIEGLRVIAPLGGHPDEDLKSMLKVADSVEGIEVVVTGKWKNPVDHPKVRYLGFLPRVEYVRELLEARAGMCLLQGNKMTLPYVLFEFASAGLPFVVSKTPATEVVGKAFLVSDATEAAERLEGMKDEGRYTSAVSEVERLRDVLREKSEEGMQRLRHAIESHGQ